MEEENRVRRRREGNKEERKGLDGLDVPYRVVLPSIIRGEKANYADDGKSQLNTKEDFGKIVVIEGHFRKNVTDFEIV